MKQRIVNFYTKDVTPDFNSVWEIVVTTLTQTLELEKFKILSVSTMPYKEGTMITVLLDAQV